MPERPPSRPDQQAHRRVRPSGMLLDNLSQETPAPEDSSILQPFVV
jgi:hypothetical protein